MTVEGPAHVPLPLSRQLQVVTQRLLDDLVALPAILVFGLASAIGLVVVSDGLFANQLGQTAAHHGHYLAFLIPAGLLGASTVSGTAGFHLARDVEDGYFDRLLTMPISRVAIIGPPVLLGTAYAVLQSFIVLGFGALLGATPKTGVLGAAVMLLITSLWGMGIAGYMVVAGLMASDFEIVRIVDLVLLPLVFLSPLVLPREALSGWMESLVALNPTTYVIEGLRALMVDGWDVSRLAAALGAALAFALVTVAPAVVAARLATARR
jgi:ABC-2 type transport system permease protein